MATRREDERARRNWLQLRADVEAADRMRGIIFDRTRSGCVAQVLKDAGWKDGSSKVVVRRQSFDAPLREVWGDLRDLEADWILGLADDDEWRGLSLLRIPHNKEVVAVLPQLFSELDGQTMRVPDSELRTQHILHGALRRDVWSIASPYLSDAPAPWGGEDMLLLFLAQQMGTFVRDPHYEYVWNAHNWSESTADSSISAYLKAAGWGESSNLSTYLLCQSLDRLAVGAYAWGVLSPHEWSELCDEAMARFWPVTDKRNHRLWVRLPEVLRSAVLKSRGDPRRSRVHAVAKALMRLERSGAKRQDTWNRLQDGRLLIKSEFHVRDLVIPALQAVAPEAVQLQIQHWERCIRRVCEQRIRLRSGTSDPQSA